MVYQKVPLTLHSATANNRGQYCQFLRAIGRTHRKILKGYNQGLSDHDLLLDTLLIGIRMTTCSVQTRKQT